MRRVYSFLMSACACALVVHPVHAQISTDSTTSFRPGEWGVGFVEGRGLNEAGVLRFSTPTRAWVLDGWAVLDQVTYPGGGLFGADASLQNTSLFASLGPRWYRGLSTRVVRFAGFGVLGAYTHGHSSLNPSTFTNWSMGGYGEVGVTYMFSRHFGLGWRGTVLASRTHDNATQPNGLGGPTGQEATTYHVELQPVQVTGTIYF